MIHISKLWDPTPLPKRYTTRYVDPYLAGLASQARLGRSSWAGLAGWPGLTRLDAGFRAGSEVPKQFVSPIFLTEKSKARVRFGSVSAKNSSVGFGSGLDQAFFSSRNPEKSRRHSPDQNQILVFFVFSRFFDV